MKAVFRVLCFALCALLALTPIPLSSAPASLHDSLSAESALLMDGEGRVLFSKNSQRRMGMASTTKIMTALIVAERLPLDSVIPIPEEAVNTEGSSVYLSAGELLSAEQLLCALLLSSANDAAVALAIASAGSVAGFAALMNAKAAELGLVDTHFVNPHGLYHEDHYTTIDDLVRLCEVVLTEPAILKYTGMAVDSVKLEDRELEWMNTNALLHDDAALYQSNTIGLKTGYTEKAGNCLISAFFMEDRILLIGVFGCPAFSEDRYLDTIAIYNSL